MAQLRLLNDDVTIACELSDTAYRRGVVKIQIKGEWTTVYTRVGAQS